jgi:hypothetical protein
MSETFGVAVVALRDIGLRDAKDRDIFLAAQQANAVVMTKDSDFVALLEHYGPPPQIRKSSGYRTREKHDQLGSTSDAYSSVRRRFPGTRISLSTFEHLESSSAEYATGPSLSG